MLVASAISLGQTIDPQRATDAQALYEQAVAEMDAGKFASACKKLEEVTRLVPEGVGGKYTLGECYEQLGRLASAWTQFAFAEQVAMRLGQTDRAEDASKRAAALKPKLATLSIIVPAVLSQVPGISVVRNGVELREPQWATALYVDAGQHELVVTAPGYTTWKKRIEVLTDGVNVKFSVPEGAIKPDPKAKPQGGEPIVPVVIAPPAPDRTWQMPLGMASVGVGAVAIVAGAIFGGVAIATKNDSNADGHCDVQTNRCDEFGRLMREKAVEWGNVSTGLIIAGSALAAGGVLLWVTAPPPKQGKRDELKPNASGGEVRARIVMAPGWLGVRGTF